MSHSTAHKIESGMRCAMPLLSSSMNINLGFLRHRHNNQEHNYVTPYNYKNTFESCMKEITAHTDVASYITSYHTWYIECGHKPWPHFHDLLRTSSGRSRWSMTASGLCKSVHTADNHS
eukprot:4245931-Amphidinium_carterae.1